MTERPAAAAAYRRPESVLVIVYTEARDCLLLERVDPPGFWQSVTGTLDWGETPAQAARREVREETQIQGGTFHDPGITRRFPILPAWRARFAPEVTENREHLWYLELTEREAVKLDPEEHRRYRWLPVAAAIELASSWTNRAGLKRLVTDA